MDMENENEDYFLGEIVYRIESISGKITYCLDIIDEEKQMDRFFESKTKSLLAEFL
jgi:hypothetical protein